MRRSIPGEKSSDRLHVCNEEDKEIVDSELYWV